MNTLEVLRKARELISDPARWTQGEIARDTDGVTVHADHRLAVCWCAIGAVKHAAQHMGVHDVYKVFDALDQTAPGGLVVQFNDDPATTHDDVLAMFDRAIAALSDQR